MSLLQQDSTGVDDAAKGEELTKGTSHVVWAAVVATLVVGLAIAIYVIAGQKPPIAKGEIIAVWAHPQHTVTSGLDASGAPMPQENVDQVMVFARVRIHNQSDHAIILNNATTNVTLDDGIHSSYAANKSDYDRLFGSPIPTSRCRTDRRFHRWTRRLTPDRLSKESLCRLSGRSPSNSGTRARSWTLRFHSATSRTSWSRPRYR